MKIKALAERDDAGQDKSYLRIISERASGYFPYGTRTPTAIPTITSGTVTMITNRHSRFTQTKKGEAKSLYQIIDMSVYA